MRNRFWSSLPPRTIMPASPSSPGETPGCICKALIRSTSPMMVGMLRICSGRKKLSPMAALFTLFCRRPTISALFNLTVRAVLSAAERTESVACMRDDSPLWAPNAETAVELPNNSNSVGRERECMGGMKTFGHARQQTSTSGHAIRSLWVRSPGDENAPWQKS